MESEPGVSSSPERPHTLCGVSWMLADKAVRLVIGQGVVLVLITRYLGPEQFGQLSYAMALAAIGAALGGLGLDEIVVRELVSRPERRSCVLATAFLLKAVGALGAMVFAVTAAALIRPGEPATWLLVAIVAAGQLLAPWDIAEWSFQAEHQFGRAVLARHGAFLFAAGLKIALMLGEASVGWLALAIAVEPLIGGGLLAISWRRMGGRLHLAAADRTLAVALVREGAWLMLSGLMVLLSLQGDKVLVAALAGDAAAGRYAAALRLPELCFQIPVVLGVALMPALVRLRQADAVGYWRMVRRLALGLGLGTGALSAVFILGAERWIALLYGGRFAEAAPILAAHATTLVFVSLVSLRSRVLILERQTGTIALLAAITAGMGLALNLWAIPRYGALGAAWVSTGTWGVCALLAPALLPQTRGMLREFLGRRSAAPDHFV